MNVKPEIVTGVSSTAETFVGTVMVARSGTGVTGITKLDAVVAKADEALYVAKSRGRNRVELADAGEA